MAPLLARLRERKLVQWALAYLAGAWVVLQVFGELRDTFGWSPLYGRLLTAILAVGLLAALVLAWYHGERGQQRVSGPELLMLAALLVLAGVAVAWVGGDAESSRGRAMSPDDHVHPAVGYATDRQSIAVLPFANLSADPDNEYFSDGITEEVLHALSRVPALRVPGRTSSFYFKERALPTREIARQLGVSHVVEGSVRREGNRVRIHVQLVDPEAERSVWSEGYDREVEDVFAVQEEIARAIAERLEVELAHFTFSRVATSLPDPEAYDLYLRGRSLWAKRGAENLRQAIAFFDAAVARDSSFAPAHAGRALALSVLPGYVDHPDRSMIAAAEASARTALALDPRLTDASLALARTAWLGSRWDEAEAAFRRVLARDPSNPTAHLWYSSCLLERGRPEEALRFIRRATELDPFSQVAWWNLTITLGAVRRSEDAVAAGRRALALDTASVDATHYLARAFVGAGALDSALLYAERATRLAPDNAVEEGLLAYVEGISGRPGQARERLRGLLEERERRGFSDVALGMAYLGLGARDSALTWLERSVDRHALDVRENDVFTDPLFVDPLGADPRFQALARRLGIIVYTPEAALGELP